MQVTTVHRLQNDLFININAVKVADNSSTGTAPVNFFKCLVIVMPCLRDWRQITNIFSKAGSGKASE